MITALAKAHEIVPIFIGQPVPFYNFSKSPETYPFKHIMYPVNQSVISGYDMFKKSALEGKFGKYFIWCGDVFSEENKILYADSIHYSKDGARLLAKKIVKKIFENGIVTTNY
jgi:hypothetical protein